MSKYIWLAAALIGMEMALIAWGVYILRTGSTAVGVGVIIVNAAGIMVNVRTIRYARG